MSVKTLQPLLFVKVRSRLRLTSEARNSANAERQLLAIMRWAEQQGQDLAEPSLLLARTRAPYYPERDTYLRALIENARAEERLLVMDDVFQFTTGCDAAEAREIFSGLLRLEPPILSIRHGAPLSGLHAEIIKTELLRCVFDFRQRSKRAKQGSSLHRDLGVAPTRKALEAAALARRLVADHKARQLAEEIAQITRALPAEKQSSRSAIARALNEAGIAPPSGAGKWQGTTVARVLDRARRLESE